MIDTPDSTTPLKRCSRGDNCIHPMGCWQPATPEYFSRNRSKPDGLKSDCKQCTRKANRQFYEQNRELCLTSQQRWRTAHPEYAAQWREANPEKVLAASRRYNINHPEAKQQQGLRWRVANPNKVRHNNRRWYEANREYAIRHSILWRKRNPGRRLLTTRLWRNANREIVRERNRKRRALKASLPATFTAEHERVALEYFGHCCAVCGRPLNDPANGRRGAFDHWIPITKGGGTTPKNMVPLCHGIEGCNNSKGNRMPDEWLVWKFDGLKVMLTNLTSTH